MLGATVSPIAHVILSHVVSIVGFAMAIVLIADVLRSRRPAGSAMAWMLAIVLAPYLGVPLYLALGGRKMLRAAQKKQPLYIAPEPGATARSDIERMLINVGAPPGRDGNDIRLLETGEAAFQALLEIIDGAQATLDVSTLILAGDEVGQVVIERLAARAQAGVRVRVLVDALFRLRSTGGRLAKLTRAGGQLAWFMPVVHVPFRGHANLRLHRKMVIADGRTALVGGMNIAREYMGPVPLPGRWRDLSASLQGSAVGDVAAIFESDWQFATGRRGEPVRLLTPSPATVAVAGDATVQVVGSGPDVVSDRIYDALLTATFTARHRLWIATPYFIPDEALAKAFVLAARRGVDVRVLVPARSNHRIADYAGASYLRDVVEAGGRVFCYLPGMMHAKVAVIDDALGVLGSANVDMRSFFLDYEIALLFSSAPEVQGLATWFEATLADARPLGPAKRSRRLVEDVTRVFGPLI